MNFTDGDEIDYGYQSKAAQDTPNGVDFNSSEDLGSQPATQPLDGSFEMEESQGPLEGVWGHLYPHSGTFPRLVLKQETFKLGRARTMDYFIKESDMGSQRWLTDVSKFQCEITRGDKGVFLRDCSSNGTWVNGNKVGKANLWPLEHNSVISFAGAAKKVNVFMST